MKRLLTECNYAFPPTLTCSYHLCEWSYYLSLLFQNIWTSPK